MEGHMYKLNLRGYIIAVIIDRLGRVLIAVDVSVDKHTVTA